MLQQHSKNIIQGSWRSCENVHAWNMSCKCTCRRFHNVLVSGTCCKSFEEDVTTYQEHLANYLYKKSLQHVSGRSCKLLTSRKMLQRTRNVLQATWRYLTKMLQHSKEHHSSYLKKMWQRACMEHVLQVTCRRFNNVPGTCCKSLEEDVTAYQQHLAS